MFIALIFALAAVDDYQIAQLGSPVFAEREAASRAIAKRGKDAKSMLARAVENDDAEIRARAARLLEKIKPEPMPMMAEIDPDELKKIVAKYGCMPTKEQDFNCIPRPETGGVFLSWVGEFNEWYITTIPLEVAERLPHVAQRLKDKQYIGQRFR